MALRQRPPEPGEPRRYQVKLGRARLFLSDLAAIVEDLRESTGGVSIHAGDFEAPEVEDLKESKRRDRRMVTLVTRDPAIVAEMYFRNPNATTTDESDEAKELVDRLARMVRSQSRWWTRTVANGLKYLLFVATALALYVALGFAADRFAPWLMDADSSSMSDSEAIWLLVLYFVVVPIAAGVTGAVATAHRGSILIIPENRSDRRSRVRDVLLGIGGGLAGAVATYVLTRLLG